MLNNYELRPTVHKTDKWITVSVEVRVNGSPEVIDTFQRTHRREYYTDKMAIQNVINLAERVILKLYQD